MPWTRGRGGDALCARRGSFDPSHENAHLMLPSSHGWQTNLLLVSLRAASGKDGTPISRSCGPGLLLTDLSELGAASITQHDDDM